MATDSRSGDADSGGVHFGLLPHGNRSETQLKIVRCRPILAGTMYCIKARKERRRERPEETGGHIGGALLQPTLVLYCIDARKKRHG